jgi:RNA 2',3'-cyclic 3'-phosphodiesterase
MIRAFIAITLPVVLQQALEEVQARCQQLPVAWRWVPPEHRHLTMKFLGDVPAESIASVTQAMQQAATGRPPFTLVGRALGCFPHPARPRVLWMGLDDTEGALYDLLQRLEAALRERGFSLEDRPLRPHVTLARIRQVPRGDHFRTLLHTYRDRHFGELPVTALCLFQSQLRREGAVYTLLHSAALSSAPLVEAG